MTIVERCKQLVKDIYDQFDASHDWQHIERVMQNAKAILKTEPSANAEIVELSVLLHDVSDSKYTDSKENEQRILQLLDLSKQKQHIIREIIASVSYNGGNQLETKSIEAQIVRDADRLDAIGAVGIARTFAYGGAKGRKLYDDQEEARYNMSVEDYRKKQTASVTHFYEKLLLLKDLMTTTKGKQMAKERHEFMVCFLKQLKNERDGEL
ncbi:HD domain-containing protein [Viridibacillus sp. YIM B01967]|uniref:HD domain-containing protein n=1 Tax=Viridibacillus soli TaxID=2798301 RepID=A0ABS1H6E1_9BACL|nr:HD domain-containing protein [Viridibacillus soli]MBK3494971.1 HD domain-containing protein [Viridibacillus soli]